MVHRGQLLFMRLTDSYKELPMETIHANSMRHMRNRLSTIVAGLSLLIPAAFGLLLAKGPTVAFPFPALMFVPSFLIHRVAVGVALPVVCFFIWNPGLFRGEHRIPKRSFVLLIFTTGLSLVWFAIGWTDGLAIQGARYTYLVCTINVVWILCLWAAFARNWKRASSFSANLVVHWMLFAWLAWYAFPFFGELI